MKKIYKISFFLFFLSINLTAQTVFVKPNGTGNGSSWQQAVGDLSALLRSPLVTNGTQIWVAAGTYFPTATVTNRDASFEIPNGVQVFGGFSGTETQLSQRNWRQNQTILSGDINQDADTTGNSYNIVYFGFSIDNATILDGFAIKNGNASKSVGIGERGSSGAGIYLDGKLANNFCNPTIRNCLLERNRANAQGGAVIANGGFSGACNARFFNCIFQDNFSIYEGAAMAGYGYFSGTMNATFERCVFERNLCNQAGGAIFINAIQGVSLANYINCRFLHNQTLTYGGAIYNLGKNGICSPNITGCLFYDNRALSAAAIYCLASERGQSSPNITNCTIAFNQATTGGSIYSNAGEDSSGIANAVIRNTIIWGNTAVIAPVLRNIHGKPRLENCIVDAASCANTHSGTGSGTVCNVPNIYNQYPNFNNTTTGDFHLQANSLGRNMGINNYLNPNYMLDLDSLNRISEGTVDIGAFEFQQMVAPPSITSQPIAQTLCEGENLTLSLTATGARLSYQWQRNGTNLVNQTTQTLQINAITTLLAGNYTCVVTDSLSRQIVSNTATIVVRTRANVSATLGHQPFQINENEFVTFKTTVQNNPSGGNLSYQWFRNNNVIVGETNDSLRTNIVTRFDRFRCNVTTSAACVVSNVILSNTDSVNVVPLPPSILLQPIAYQRLCENNNALPLRMRARGTRLRFQWTLNGANVANATDSILQINNVSLAQMGSYKCVVTDSLGRLVITDSSKLDVIERLMMNISILKNRDSIIQGQSVTFTAAPRLNRVAPTTLQWFKNGQPMANETAITYTTTLLQHNDRVQCRMMATDSCSAQNVVFSNIDSAIIVRPNVVIDVLNAVNIRIFPNPVTNGVLYLDLKNAEFSTAQTMKIEWWTLDGKLLNLQQMSIQNGIFALEMPNILGGGLFLLKIQFGNQTITKKIIIL